MKPFFLYSLIITLLSTKQPVSAILTTATLKHVQLLQLENRCQLYTSVTSYNCPLPGRQWGVLEIVPSDGFA